MNPFDVWAPIFRAPFSGDVTQEIVPRFFFPEIKGNAAIERKIQIEVASYGKQLGKILEALQALSAKTDVALPEIDALVREIEKVKQESQDEVQADAEAALERLKRMDEKAWRDLVGKR